VNPIAAIPPLIFSPTTLPAGTQNTAYSQQLTITNGVAPYTCTATAVPTGLSVTSGCLVSGTPTIAGSFTMNVTATDSRSPTPTSTTMSYALTIAMVITPPNPPSNVKLSWSWSGLDIAGAVEHLHHFEIGRSTSSSGPFQVITTIPVSTPLTLVYVDVSAPSPQAWYIVTAVDTNQNRSASSVPVCYGSGCPTSASDATPPSSPFSPVAR